jgi:peptidoglycan/LPS O-acetylase OafA/YrhL
MAPARNRNFPLVHSMRALASVSVLLYHGLFKGYLSGRPESPLTPYLAHLDVGVSVFFLISAFLLYRPMVAARLNGEPPIDADAYGRRRLLRIVPGYWVALIVAGIAGASYFGYRPIFSGQGAIGYFGFLQIYNPDTSGGGINVSWTLCVELTFYAFLPLWALAMRRLSPRGGVRSELVGLGLLFAASVGWQVLAVHSTNPNAFGLSATRWLEPLPNFLDQFAVGMALAVASVVWERRRGRVLAWVLAGVAFWVVSTQLGLHGDASDNLTPLTYLARHQLYTLVALGLMWPAVFGSRRGSRVVAFVGTISFGIYLYHVPVFVTLGRSWGLPADAGELALWLGVGVSVTFALAFLSWRLVERPALRLAHRARRAQKAVEPALGRLAG